jgi:hypothetical protein
MDELADTVHKLLYTSVMDEERQGPGSYDYIDAQIAKLKKETDVELVQKPAKNVYVLE